MNEPFHSEWWQQKVQASRAGLADGSNNQIAPDEWERIRAEKKRQRGEVASTNFDKKVRI